MKQSLTISCLILLLFGSLITFPGSIEWMIAVWIIVALSMSFRKQRAWPWLVCLTVVLVVKQPGLTLEFWLLLSLIAVTSALDYFFHRSSQLGSEDIDGERPEIAEQSTGETVRILKRFQIQLAMAFLLIAGLVFFGVKRHLGTNISSARVLDDRPIACLGDSLTDYGYPDELKGLISVPIADFGVDGITTDDGIKMLPEILATDPQTVVIELGGHDYNADRKSRAATKANLEFLIESFLSRDIGVILVEIPRGFITDPYRGLERELTEKYDLQLIDDSVIRSFVFFGPILPPGSWLPPDKRLSDDGLHPNSKGNRFFAEAVARSLSHVYGDKILHY